MAKVMVSIPDELLANLDREAADRGESRSGMIQRLIEREVAWRSPERQARVETMLALASSQGGDAVGRVRAGRVRR